jgi:small subunit ribosomal protein S2
MLTNFETIAKRVAKMQEYERMRQSGEFDAMPKKEALLLTRELEKLQKNLGGIRGMSKRPDAVFILDTKKEHIAVTEANKLGIPIIAVVDTNVDPDVIQYPIPGNDDAIRANALMSRVIAEAIDEGRYIAGKRNPQAQPKQRSAEDEAAFAATQAEARRQAAAAQAERDSRLAASASETEPAMDESTLDESSSTGVDDAADALPGTPAETLAEATTTEITAEADTDTTTTETEETGS